MSEGAASVSRGAEARTPPAVDVVAGVLSDASGRILFGRRPAGKVYTGYWELPGGKVEPGETLRAALTRELHEELGIGVTEAEPWIVRTHVYAHARVKLHFFRVARWDGDVRAREHLALAWYAPGEPVPAPMLPANGPILAALALPDRYAISNAADVGADVFLRALGAALDDGVRMVLIREPHLAAAEVVDLAGAAVALCRPRGARLLVHTDESIARAVAADGVHYPARALRTLAGRPDDLLCAASCHDAAELARAAELGMDFAVLGPVLPTLSHPGAPTLGWDGLAALLEGVSLPVYAIGGLSGADVPRARSSGALGVAMIRAAWRMPPKP